MNEYDVITVGARVAGSTLAALLGDAGHRVLLLDRATFPSDTLSTHYFRAPALRAFDKLGVRQQVEASASKMTVDYNVVDGLAFRRLWSNRKTIPTTSASVALRWMKS